MANFFFLNFTKNKNFEICQHFFFLKFIKLMKITINITIKTNYGTTRTIEVEKSSTILSLKEKLYQLEGQPVRYQRILFQGQPLQDTETMESAGIEEGSVIHQIRLLVGY